MRVLIGCEFSGRVRDVFRNAGHEAWSCDILGSRTYWNHPNKKAREFWRKTWDSQRWPEYHLVGDVREWLDLIPRWDLFIAHPDCTYLCNSGVQHLYLNPGEKPLRRDPERAVQCRAGAVFFNELWQAPIERIALENPVMHGYARQWIQQPEPTQRIDLCDFGEPDSKKTCLWLKNLPPLKPTGRVKVTKTSTHYASPNPLRGLMRSVTFPGVAAAMLQWATNDR